MFELQIPHEPPLRFVKSIVSKGLTNAMVRVEFESIPSIGMLSEAAAQSSCAISDNDDMKMGFLVTLKNIKILQQLKETKYIVDITLVHKVNDFESLSFDILENQHVVATGSFSIAIQ